MRDKLVANIIFIFEIEVKSTLGNACFIYNIRDRRLVGPFCGKKLKGCIEQSIFLFLLFHFQFSHTNLLSGLLIFGSVIYYSQK